MKKLPTILIVCICIFTTFSDIHAALSSSGCLEADILIVVDWSGSTQSEHSSMVGAIYAYSRSFVLTDNGIKIGIVSFGDNSTIVSPITADTDVLDQGMMTLLADNANHGTVADDVPALIHTLMLQSMKERGRMPLRRFVIFISDGDIHNRREIRTELVRASTSLEIMTFAIWLGESSEDSNNIPYVEPREDVEMSGRDFMKLIASPGCFLQSDYSSLRDFLIRLNLCI